MEIKSNKHLNQVMCEVSHLAHDLSMHPVYDAVSSMGCLRVYQEAHVCCVWDFMSLLKRLQLEFTCVGIPWFPTNDSDNSRFINEIVLGEECDDVDGRYISHYDLYLDSMRETGANITAITDLVKKCSSVTHYSQIERLINDSDIPAPSKQFNLKTFDVVFNGKLHEIAAFFAIGREKIIPEMFTPILDRLGISKSLDFDKFKTYLARHIELDGEEHGYLSERLLCSICGSDESMWEQTRVAAISSLKARKDLWDSVYDEIIRHKKKYSNKSVLDDKVDLELVDSC